MRGSITEEIRNLLENSEIDSDHKLNVAARELENCILDSKEVRDKKEKDNLGVKVILLAYYFCKEDIFFPNSEARERVFDVLMRTIESFKDEGFIISRVIYALRVRNGDSNDPKGFDYGTDREFIEKCISRITDVTNRRVITHLREGEYENRIVEISRRLRERITSSSPFGRPVGKLGSAAEPVSGGKPKERRRA